MKAMVPGRGQISNCLLTMALVSLLAGCGVMAPSSNEGYADLDSLGFRDVDTTMSLSLGPSVLRFAANHIEDDPETEQLLLDLKGVRVKSYDITGDVNRVADRIDGMKKKLEEQGWMPIISVREPGERTVVLMKMRNEEILGLTVINCDAYEAVIVNVMGSLRPEMFNHTMAVLDVDAPDVDISS